MYTRTGLFTIKNPKELANIQTEFFFSGLVFTGLASTLWFLRTHCCQQRQESAGDCACVPLVLVLVSCAVGTRLHPPLSIVSLLHLLMCLRLFRHSLHSLEFLFTTGLFGSSVCCRFSACLVFITRNRVRSTPVSSRIYRQHHSHDGSLCPFLFSRCSALLPTSSCDCGQIPPAGYSFRGYQKPYCDCRCLWRIVAFFSSSL